MSTESRLDSNMLKGVVLVALSALFYASKAIFVKLAYRYDIDSVTLMTLRMLFSLPFYIIIALFSVHFSKMNKLTTSQWFSIGLVGVFGYYLASLFDLQGLQYLSASFERLIVYLYPSVVLLLSALLFKQRIRGREVAALIIGYGGLVLIFIHDFSLTGDEIVLGVSYVLLSVLAFAIFIIASGRLIPVVGANRFTAIAMIAASVAIFIHFYLTHQLSAIKQPREVYLLSLGIAIISTVIPTLLLAHGIKIIGANNAALVGAVGPVTTIIMAVVILGEIISVLHVVGSLLVLCSVIMLCLKTRS